MGAPTFPCLVLTSTTPYAARAPYTAAAASFKTVTFSTSFISKLLKAPSSAIKPSITYSGVGLALPPKSELGVMVVFTEL